MLARTLVTGGSGFIGTHLVDALLEAGHDVLNVSRTPPPAGHGERCFRRVDVCDEVTLIRCVEAFQPHAVVHLAARTDFVGRADDAGFRINTVGTVNVARALRRVRQPVRLLHVSSNVVEALGVGRPDAPLAPKRHSYEHSKVVAEQLVERELPAHVSYCIARPCYVWGPGFRAPFRDFFLSVARGRYLHLGDARPEKRITFVGNLVQQLLGLLRAPAEAIHGRSFYLAEYELTTIGAWAELIARTLGLPPPATLPEWAVRAAAATGDALSLLFGRPAPLTSVRLENMRADTSGIPVAPIRELVPELPFTLDAGVRETVSWLRSEGLLRQDQV